MTLPIDEIVCGDNVSVLSTFPDDCIDLVVTSPPYDNLRTYGGHSWDFEGVAAQLVRVIKPGGVIVWVVADRTENGSESGTSMEQALYFKCIGLNLHDTMVYQKDGAPPLTHNRYEQSWEFMFVFSKGRPATFNPLQEKSVRVGERTSGTKRHDLENRERQHGHGRQVKPTKIKSNVWLYGIGWNKTSDEAVAFDHPAIFPESLAGDHIKSWSNEGDLVLDPFAGSGTTCKAAKILQRRFIGVDVNEDYCEIARKRLEQGVFCFA